MPGIVIDTNNFMNQAGVRTFEAAAFLRRNGADVVRVRKLFRDKLEDYKARAEAIQKAEIFKEYFAISECPAEGIESPTVVGGPGGERDARYRRNQGIFCTYSS